jgi:hypothetical protein
MTFTEAYNTKKRIKRPHWDHWINPHKGTCNFSFEDMKASDWVVE